MCGPALTQEGAGLGDRALVSGRIALILLLIKGAEDGERKPDRTDPSYQIDKCKQTYA
ncbi:hypothetical protein ACMAY8_08580 [Rhodobacteraceae bacterium nBUS_22]